jgi:hypothetical protein
MLFRERGKAQERSADAENPMGAGADYRPTMVQLPLRRANVKWTIVRAGSRRQMQFQ